MKSFKLIVFALIVFTLYSCSKGTEVEKPVETKNNILLTSTVVNPDGQSGSSYVQLIDNLQAKSYDNTSALPFTFFHKPVIEDGVLYELPFFGQNSIVRYKAGANGGLEKAGELSIEENASPSGMAVLSKTKAYISFWRKGEILIFQPESMKKLGEIDIFSHGIEDANPDAAQMIIRDKHLFVALGQNVGGFFPSAERPASDVLVIDTDTDKVIKMITETASGISNPTRPNDPNSIFIDEKKDVYITGIAGFGARPTHKTGFLRIKNGETDFDPTWSLPVESVTIDGEVKRVDYVQYSQYAGNGKLFAIVNVPAYYSNPLNYLNDRTCVAVEIDLRDKSVKVIKGLPRSNSYCSVTKYKESIVFGLDGSEQSGYFTYDLNTGKVSSSPVIKVQGAPTGLYPF